MKKKGTKVMMKQSRSAIDIRQELLDQKDTFRLGSRSLSHDSIFLSETRQSTFKLSPVLSKETVHGKVQALQIKLQRQKIRFGPPPPVLPFKQIEDKLQASEVLMSKNLPNKSSSKEYFPYPISPTLPPVYSSAPSPGLDFSTLPQLIPCLDSSAARHRMSIKPRNQRASTKSRRIPHSDGSRPRSESMIILERPLAEHKTEDDIVITKEITRIRSYSSQIIRPQKGHIATSIKSPGPSLPPKLLLGANDDSNSCAVGQCKGEEKPAVSTIVPKDGGTKQILKLAEGKVTDHSNSSGPNSHKESIEHKESMCSSNPMNVDGGAVSVHSVYTSSSTEQFQPKSDKELSMVTQIKDNASNRYDPRFQTTMQEYFLESQPLKPRTLLNNKSESKKLNPISSLLLSKERSEVCLQESTNQRQSQSYSVSSDKRQRTGSFTDKIKQAEGQQEPIIPPTNLNRQDLHKNPQVMETGIVSSQIQDFSTTVVLTSFRDLTTDVSAGQDRRDRLANKTRDMAVETQIDVKETDETNKKRKMNKASQEQKVGRSVSELKLHTPYSSEVHDKHQNPEVMGTPRVPEFALAVSQNDRMVVPVRETVFKSPPLYNTEFFSPSESPVFPRKDQERHAFIRYSDLQASPQFACSTINMTMSTNAKESRDASSELSWMRAREKTRNFQQLFTSTLNDPTGLQTVTQPAASTSKKILTQYSSGPTNPTAAQLSTSPLEMQLPSTVYASIQTTIQTPLTKSSVSLVQPFIDQSGATLSTGQIQPFHLNTRSGQISAHSTSKPLKAGIYMPSTQIIHATQQSLSQMPLHQVYPIQQSLSQSVTKPQFSQSLCLSHSPKLTPRQPPHQSLSPVLHHRPISLPLEKVNWTAMPQEKSQIEGQAPYTESMGSKTPIIEQWHHQKPDTVKAEQKPTPDAQTYHYLDEFPTLTNRSKFTDLAVSPRPMRLDREVKWQKETFSPPSPTSSSSHLESSTERRQPSWMEMAKRKSMAWSDKTMD